MTPLSPTVRRRRLTAELRRLREESGQTIDMVAEKIGTSKSALSRIENGLVAVKLPVLRALLAEYQVSEERQLSLEQLAREASQKGWWQVVAGNVPSNEYKTLVGLEAESSWENYFSATVITGLLQTEDYAQAVLKAVLPDVTEEDIQQALKFRIRRQERLGDLRLWMILAEEHLTRPVGGSRTMRRQIEHLIAASNDRGITVQIIGREAGAYIGMSGGFTVVGLEPQSPEAVYIEGNGWDACVEDPEQLARYMRSFELLRAVALSPEQSRLRMSELAEGHVSDD